MGFFTRLGGYFNIRRTSSDTNYNSSHRFVWSGKTIAGVYMTHDEAIRLSAVWACICVISKAIASSCWDVFSEDDDGNRSMLRTSRLWSILNTSPNPEMTAFSFKETAMIIAMIWGNFYAEIEFDVSGRPIALWPLDPSRCVLDREFATGRLILRVTNYDRGETILGMESVFQLHGPGIDGVAGFDVVRLAAQSLGHTKAAEVFGAAFFGNYASPGGILSSDKTLTTPQKDDLRAEVNKKKGSGSFGYMVLDGGLKWQSPMIDQRSSQFIESRSFQIAEVCRWFGVPPHKIADLQESTNNNIEHQGLEFVRDALVPWCERLRQEADRKLTPVRGKVRTRFDTEWLAEGDASTRASTDSTLVNSGLATRNEVRRRRGWNVVKGGGADLLTVQSAMVPVDMIEDIAKNQAKAQPAALPEPETQKALPAPKKDKAKK